MPHNRREINSTTEILKCEYLFQINQYKSMEGELAFQGTRISGGLAFQGDSNSRRTKIKSLLLRAKYYCVDF